MRSGIVDSGCGVCTGGEYDPCGCQCLFGMLLRGGICESSEVGRGRGMEASGEAEELLAKFTVRTAALLSELLVREPVMAIPVKEKLRRGCREAKHSPDRGCGRRREQQLTQELQTLKTLRVAQESQALQNVRKLQESQEPREQQELWESRRQGASR